MVPLLSRSACMEESNLGGTTGAITRPFAGRVFFVCRANQS